MKYLGLALLLAIAVTAVTPVWKLASSRPDGPGQADDQDRATVRWIEARGQVEPRTGLRHLAFETGGILAECHVEVGSRVVGGEILARLRDDEPRAAEAVARGRLHVARAERDHVDSGTHEQQIAMAAHDVALLEEQVRHLQREHGRLVTLSESAAVSDQQLCEAAHELQQALTRLERARAELTYRRTIVTPEERALANRRIELAESELERARVLLDRTRLRAPFDGQVLNLLRREGDAVDEISRPTVVVFGDTTRLRVRAEVDERFVRQVRIGMPVVVGGHNLQGKTYRGKVSQVTPCMGAGTLRSGAASERSSLDVAEVLVDMEDQFSAPVGLQVDVQIQLATDDQPLDYGSRD